MSRKQAGVTLIELILVISLLSVMTLLSFYEKQSDLEQARARQVGGMLFQYNNAVRSALAQGLVTANTTKHGTSWLKNLSCGGPLPVNSEFLPCDFPSATTLDPIKFGNLSLDTAIVVSGVAPKRKVLATTVSSPFSLSSRLGVPIVRADLAGVASLSAAAALTSGFQAVASKGLSPYTATTDASYSSDPISAKITSIASNTAGNDVWLRTDGGNSMHASLNFDGANAADRTIVGASSIENFAGQMLKIGSGSGLMPTSSAGVVIDSTGEILGDFRVRKKLYVEDTLSVEGDITANGNVIAKGDISSEREITGQMFYDADDRAYYLDPDKVSNLNELSAATVTTTGRVKAGEYIEISGLASVGGICTPDGLLAKDNTGSIIACKDGKWSAMGGASPVGIGTGFMTGIGGSYPNRITKGHSCPAGLVPNLIGGIQIGGCNPCYTYSCSLP